MHGGIIGIARNILIQNTSNRGEVSAPKENLTSKATAAGGIAGALTNNTIIDGCNNSNIISGGNNIGGIVGVILNESTYTNIINSYNTGTVSTAGCTDENDAAIGRAGGICGTAKNSNENIINCYNKGTIQGNTCAGGIMGLLSSENNSSILNCYNIGTISDASSNAYGIMYRDNTNSTINANNAYYLNSLSAGINISPDPSTQMTEADMKATNFVTTLNTNKNSINLSTYGLSDYSLLSWKAVTNGYPEFDN